MKIILIRHGMTQGNKNRRYIGITDEPLMDTDCLRREYPQCKRVVASPLIRCVQTANFIYPDKEVRICKKLSECNFGDFENKSYIELRDNRDYQKWIESDGTIPFPNGESKDEFSKRCIDGFFEVISECEADTAFVIHGGSIMAVMQKLFGGNFYDYQVENGCGFEFELERGKKVNDYSTIGGA